jgi:hypothetical protein
MLFAADHSEILEVIFPPTDGLSGHLYVSQSVICEMATVQERERCVGWLFETKISHPDSTKLPHTVPMPWLPRSPDDTTGFFPVGLCQEQCLPNTS